MALAAWAKRLLPGSDGPARVVQSVLLGGGSRLLVVEFEGGRVLIGQARGGLVRLSSCPLKGEERR